MSKQSKIVSLLNLVIVGLLPILLCIYSVFKAVSQLIGIDFYIDWMSSSHLFLIFCIIQSHLLRYCKYHRGMMYGVLIADLVYYIIPLFIELFGEYGILTYNIIVLSCLLVSLLCLFKTIYLLVKYDTTRKLLKCNR